MLICVAVFAMTVCPTLAQTSRVSDMPKEAVFEEICLIPAGNGEDCVGYIDDGSVSPCPQDFLVRDDGSVCILDSVKDRIIIFKDGEVQKYLDYTGVTTATYAENFTYYDGVFYCVDTVCNTLFTVDEEMGKAARMPLDADIPYDCVCRIEVADGKLEIEFYELDEQMLSSYLVVVKAGLGKSIVERTRRTVEFDKRDGYTAVRVDGQDYNIALNSEAESIDGIYHKYNSGNILVSVTEQAPGLEVYRCEYTLRVYDNNGKCVGYALPDRSNQFSDIVNWYYVDSNDATYMMNVNVDGIHIYRITFGSGYTSSMDEVIAKGKAYQKEIAEAEAEWTPAN